MPEAQDCEARCVLTLSLLDTYAQVQVGAYEVVRCLNPRPAVSRLSAPFFKGGGEDGVKRERAGDFVE